ncbi:MAG: 2-amino-4-hydroxy-6-hydroxymethyldihydropteridine diphosphokinase [Algoriphagus sp.]|nr:2-amino-4-hydroxy-6-hydroxymethyldihydropteridine diphosphokinase [Algoriphagus sp.]
MQTEVVLCLGGNKGDREKLLSRAVESLCSRFQLVKMSPIYETEAWGGVAKGKFLNQLAVISTSWSAWEVLEAIQEIEAELGRTREEPWGDRTMDIDILFYGEEIIDTEKLKVPHPFIAERKFVLVPLLELFPDRKHPISGKTFAQMLRESEDKSEIEPYF